MSTRHHLVANATLTALLLGTLASMLVAPHFWASHGSALAADVLHAAEVLDDEVRHRVHRAAHHLLARVRPVVAR